MSISVQSLSSTTLAQVVQQAGEDALRTTGASRLSISLCDKASGRVEQFSTPVCQGNASSPAGTLLISRRIVRNEVDYGHLEVEGRPLLGMATLMDQMDALNDELAIAAERAAKLGIARAA